MKISRTDLEWAAHQGVLSPEQATALWLALEQRAAGRPRFDLAHVAYYTGALIVISAMTWFMTLGWAAFGGAGLFSIAVIYALGLLATGRMLWKRPAYRVPGGLLITAAVCMTPLAIYGLELATGIWLQGDPGPYRGLYEWVKGSWVLIELGTMIAAVVALRFFRFPFLTAPLAFAAWYMSMDLAPLLFGQADFGWDEQLWVSLVFGLLMLVVAFVVDRRTEEDFAFWGYLFGLLAFWGGLSLMDSGGELGRFVYCLINVALMVISVLLDRRVFLVFGALGVFGYLGHLAYVVFQDSLLFPVALTALGLSVIALGILYQRHHARIEQAVLRALPPALVRMRRSA